MRRFENRQRAQKIFLFILAWVFAAQLQAKEITFFVSPDGNDSATGKKPDPLVRANDGPLATLPAALKAARKARAQNADATIKIILRGGLYELSGPLVLQPEDSGASEKLPLIITAYRDENPILNGGKKIVGWKKIGDGATNLWAAEIPGARDGQWFFRTLFVNGRRQQRARIPNAGFFQVEGNILQTQPATFQFAANQIKKEWASGAEISGLAKWVNYRMQIRDVNETNRTLTLSGTPHDSSLEPNSRYFVENAPDALDQPGEWFLDRATGVVNYWAEPGVDMNQVTVIAPRLTELLGFQGDIAAQKTVRHIRLENLHFAYADWSLPDDGYRDAQAAYTIRAAVSAEAATDCALQNCSFQHLGGYALDFGRGCQRDKIIGNEIFDIGAGGLRLGESVIRTNAFEMSHHNLISDNHLHELGRVFASAVGILILQSGQNRVAHNHVHDLFYTAISVGWTWGYTESPCRENIIEFNHLHDVGQGLLSDMGGIYTLGIQSGTVLRNNLIHDVSSSGYGGWGLYTDEGSSNILLENNVVYRCKSAGFHQHYGRENVVRNNIFAGNTENQLMRTRAEPHVSFYFTNNIVYFNSGQLLGSDWTGDNFVMENNIYFDPRPEAVTNSITFAGMNFNEWQKRGHDTNSLIADPLFVAPDKFDFRLKKNSPAWKRGFKSIDLTAVGPRTR